MQHLLIVDGHPGVREALARRLRQAYTVTAVDGLAAAGEVLRRLSPAAVIVDPRTIAALPDDVLALLGLAGRPVIVLTSSLLEGEEGRLHRAGAAAILLKGRPFAELLVRIDAAIGEASPVPRRRRGTGLPPAC